MSYQLFYIVSASWSKVCAPVILLRKSIAWRCFAVKYCCVSYLYGDWTVTLDSGSRRKCCWDTSPVEVSMVTTGKPIWSTQWFMISYNGLGSETLLAFTACWQRWQRASIKKKPKQNKNRKTSWVAKDFQHICISSYGIFFYYIIRYVNISKIMQTFLGFRAFFWNTVQTQANFQKAVILPHITHKRGWIEFWSKKLVNMFIVYNMGL